MENPLFLHVFFRVCFIGVDRICVSGIGNLILRCRFSGCRQTHPGVQTMNGIIVSLSQGGGNGILIGRVTHLHRFRGIGQKTGFEQHAGDPQLVHHKDAANVAGLAETERRTPVSGSQVFEEAKENTVKAITEILGLTDGIRDVYTVQVEFREGAEDNT